MIFVAVLTNTNSQVSADMLDEFFDRFGIDPPEYEACIASQGKGDFSRIRF